MRGAATRKAAEDAAHPFHNIETGMEMEKLLLIAVAAWLTIWLGPAIAWFFTILAGGVMVFTLLRWLWR